MICYLETGTNKILTGDSYCQALQDGCLTHIFAIKDNIDTGTYSPDITRIDYLVDVLGMSRQILEDEYDAILLKQTEQESELAD